MKEVTYEDWQKKMEDSNEVHVFKPVVMKKEEKKKFNEAMHRIFEKLFRNDTGAEKWREPLMEE